MTDYDGTLAPIVADLEGAAPVGGVAGVLSALSERLDVVAVVSGRPVAFLVRQLAGCDPGVRLVGLYGMQQLVDGAVVTDPAVEPWVPVVAGVLARARSAAPAGLRLEDKTVSMTLHWREFPETAGWARRFVADVGAHDGLVARPGRMALELVPPVAPTKGTAVAQLAASVRAAAYFGDDRADLEAFEALGRLGSGGTRVVRVAVTDPESPPELARMAEQTVAGPDEAVALLGALARRLGAG